MLVIICIIITTIVIIALCMITTTKEFSKNKTEFIETFIEEETEEAEEEEIEEIEEEIMVSSLAYLIAKETIIQGGYKRRSSIEKFDTSSNRGNNKTYNKKHTSYTKYEVCPKRGYHDPRYKNHDRKTIRTIQDPEWF